MEENVNDDVIVIDDDESDVQDEPSEDDIEMTAEDDGIVHGGPSTPAVPELHMDDRGDSFKEAEALSGIDLVHGDV